MTPEYLTKMYRKKHILTEFDEVLTHITKADQLAEIRKDKLTSFGFSPEECHEFLDNLQKKDINLFSLFQGTVQTQIPENDIIALLENFGLSINNSKDNELIEQIIGKKEFEFFVPPFLSINSIKELKQKTFTGKIERFAYLSQDVRDSVTGKITSTYIPIIYLKVSHSIQPLAFDTFLYMWDISRLLVAEFFKKEEIKKEEIQYIKINDFIFKKGSFLPDLITEEDIHYPEKELFVEKIFQNPLSDKQEITVELNNGLILSYDELKSALCERKKEVYFHHVKIKKGTKLVLQKTEDIDCEVKGIFQHNDKSISLKLLNEESMEECIVRENTEDFFNLSILKSQVNIDSIILKPLDQVGFYYFSGETIDVKIISILQNLITSKEQIKIDTFVEDLTGQKTNSFSPEDFKIMLEKKMAKSYEYFIEYNDLVGIDDIFFSTDSFNQTDKEEIFFSCRSAFGKAGFYSNQQKTNKDDLSFREKLETAMIRVRRGLTFALIDTNNKYLSSASKNPITQSLIHEVFSSKNIKKSIRENMEKINKENLLYSKGSLLTFKHESSERNTVNFIHAGNSLIFVNEKDQITYQKSLDVNDFGEINNGIGTNKYLKLNLKDEQVRVNDGSQVSLISDGFPVRVENGKPLLKGILSGYEVEKLIIKANTLPIEKRHQLINAVIMLNERFEEMAFQSVPNCPKTNLDREKAYQLAKVFKDISFSPIGFFAKIINEIDSKYGSELYKRVAAKINNSSKSNVVRFIVDSILKILQVNTPKEDKQKIENYFISIGLENIYRDLAKKINMLMFFQNDKKKQYIQLKKHAKPQINFEQRVLYLKILEVVIDVYENLDQNISLLLTDILLENSDFYIDSNDLESYLVKKSKIFEPLQTVKTQLDNNQNSFKNEFVLDLEPMLRKYILSGIFKEDFTTFFYDIERTNYSDSLIYNNECSQELQYALNEYAVCDSDIRQGKISGENLLKIKKIKKVIKEDDTYRESNLLLAHPKIQVKEITNVFEKSTEINDYLKEENIDQIINSEVLGKTSFIGGVKLNSVFKKLGIEK